MKNLYVLLLVLGFISSSFAFILTGTVKDSYGNGIGLSSIGDTTTYTGDTTRYGDATGVSFDPIIGGTGNFTITVLGRVAISETVYVTTVIGKEFKIPIIYPVSSDLDTNIVETINYSGTVMFNSTPIPGVTLKFFGSVAVAGPVPDVVTGSDGSFTTPVPFNAAGQITVTKTDFIFDPVNGGGSTYLKDTVYFAGITANGTQDITTSALPTYTVAGSFGVAGVTLSGATVTGNDFTVTQDWGWVGTLTPSLNGYTFSPASITVSALEADLSSQDYTTTQLTYTITGALGMSGVAVAYSGTTSGTATITGSDYSITVPHGWVGTLTPSLSGYTFTPITLTDVTSNLTQDFTGTSGILPTESVIRTFRLSLTPTSIQVSVERASLVRLNVYDVRGAKVAGWDMRVEDMTERKFTGSTGMYFVRMERGADRICRSFLLVR